MKLHSATGLSYYVWVGLALILIFTLLEPIATETAGMVAGFIIWTLQIGLLLPILIGLHMALQTIGLFDNLNPWVKLTLSGLLGSVLFIPLGLGIDYLFALDDWSAVKSPNDLVDVIIDESGGTVLPVMVTWIAINAPRILQLDFTEKEAADSKPDRPAENRVRPGSESQFLALIPAEIGTDLVYLSSELHYVRVVTTVGEKLVLFNLKDAIADLEPITDGIQTHRSYWVSGRHIMSLISDKDRKYILTTNNRKIPVARRRVADIKEFMRQMASN